MGQQRRQFSPEFKAGAVALVRSSELCLDALQAAVAARGGRRNLAAGIVFHTDHGTSTPPGRSGRPAGRWASPSPWAPWAIAS